MKPNPYAGKTFWAFDTETHLIEPGLLAPPLVCGSWAVDPALTGQRNKEGILDKVDTLSEFRAALLSKWVIVGQNLAYDMGVMMAADPSLIPLVFDKYDRDEVFDTMIAEQLIQIAAGTLGEDGGADSLEVLGRRYLGVDMSEDKHGPDAWRLRYSELDGVPLEQWPEAAKAYPIRDARYTYDVAMRQLQDGRNLHDLPAQCRAHFALHLMSVWGVRTDAEWVEEFAATVTAEHNRTRAKYLAAGLLKVKRCTPDQEPDHIDRQALIEAIEGCSALEPTRAALLEKALADIEEGVRAMRYGVDKKALEAAITEAYNGEPPRSAPTDKMKEKARAKGEVAVGNIKADKDTLRESGVELLIEYADDQDNEKFFSTYVPVLKHGANGPINCKYNVLVDTGRTSCSKPNMQNLPRGNAAGNPREGFVARNGYVWSSNDYPTLELRTLAHTLESLGLRSAMAEALREDVDLHVKLAASIKGMTLEEFLEALAAKDPTAKDGRQMAKPVNFGLPGGLGVTKFVIFARDSYKVRLCLITGEAEVCGVEKYWDKRAKVAVCKMCRDVAVELKKIWFQTFPEMNPYFEIVKGWTSTHEELVPDDDGDLQRQSTGSITQIGSERVRGHCNFTAGANSMFQGLAADIAKRAVWYVTREAYTDTTSPLYGSRPVVFVHDEIITEHPLHWGYERAVAAAERVAELMGKAFAEYCPRIPCRVKPALMYRWHKGAEGANDADGTLIPEEKCPTCGTITGLTWAGVLQPHKTKETKTSKSAPCEMSNRLLADLS